MSGKETIKRLAVALQDMMDLEVHREVTYSEIITRRSNAHSALDQEEVKRCLV